MTQTALATNLEQCTIRPLSSSDMSAFRAIRLEAIQSDPSVFAASYEEEKARTAQQWRELAKETNERCWIGVFNEGELVGITAAMKWTGDASGKSAIFRSSYVKPEYRGRGLASKLCDARAEWADKNGYNVAMLFHREGHWIAKVVKEFGGVYHHTEPMRFADGSTANAIWYKKDLTLIPA